MSFFLTIVVALATLLIPLALVCWLAPRFPSVSTVLVWLIAPLASLVLVNALWPLVQMTMDFDRRNTSTLSLLKLLSAIVVYVLPCILAAGMGSTLQRPIWVVLIAWLLTVVLMGVVEAQSWMLVEFCCVDPHVHPMGRLPVAFTGCCTGIASAAGAWRIRNYRIQLQARLHPRDLGCKTKRA
jgi:hypothetical protein